MAFISTKEVKEIRENLKKAFPNLKFSVTTLHYSKVSVVIKSGDVDFIGAMECVDELKYQGINVSEYHFEKYFFTEETQEIIAKIFTVIKGDRWYDKSEAMIDYFDTAYYYDLKIGEWEKPYKYDEKKRVA